MASLIKRNKKGVMKGQFGFGNLTGAAIAIGVLVLVVSMMGLLLDGFQGTVDNTSKAYTIIGKGLDAMSEFGNWFNTLVLIAIMVIIIGLVLAYFGGYVGGRKGGGNVGV